VQHPESSGKPDESINREAAPSSADAVVVGGGIIGAACAASLSRDGLRAVLLERGDLAAGASGACQSLIGYGIFQDDSDLRLHRAGMDAYRRFAPDGADVDYRRDGLLLLCDPAEEASVKERLEHLRGLDCDCDWLDDTDLRHIEPALSQQISTAAILKDIAQVSPRRVITELLRRASRCGAAIHTGSELVGIEMTHGKVSAVLTAKGRIATETVVVASGAWSSEVGRFVHLQVPAWPLKGHVLVMDAGRGPCGTSSPRPPTTRRFKRCMKCRWIRVDRKQSRRNSPPCCKTCLKATCSSAVAASSRGSTPRLTPSRSREFQSVPVAWFLSSES